MDTREKTLASAHTLVVKVGSAVLTTSEGLHLSVMYNLVEQLARLVRQGRRVCLVSSGAVAGISAVPGSIRPSASAMICMVDAVPMNEHAPQLGQA